MPRCARSNSVLVKDASPPDCWQCLPQWSSPGRGRVSPVWLPRGNAGEEIFHCFPLFGSFVCFPISFVSPILYAPLFGFSPLTRAVLRTQYIHGSPLVRTETGPGRQTLEKNREVPPADAKLAEAHLHLGHSEALPATPPFGGWGWLPSNSTLCSFHSFSSAQPPLLASL